MLLASGLSAGCARFNTFTCHNYPFKSFYKAQTQSQEDRSFLR